MPLMSFLMVIIYTPLHMRNNFNPEFLKYSSHLLNETIFYEKLYLSYFFPNA